MPGPSKLTITMVPNSVANTVVIPISPALQSLDSSTPGGQQTGFQSADIAVRNIFKAGVFTDGQGNWFSAFQIISIIAS